MVAYYSAKLNPPEKNYCVTRKELLAVVKAVDHFHPYMYGAEFTTCTDHTTLRWLKTLKNPEGQLARWLGKLEQHHYHVINRHGRMLSNADSLSQRPCPPECPHCSRMDPVEVSRRTTVRELDTDTRWLEAQRDDPDIGPVLEWLSASEERL